MTKQEIAEYIRRREPEMVDFLRELVLVQSNSYNKKGVDAVGALIQSSLSNHDFNIAVQAGAEFGDQLIIRSRAVTESGPQLLLVGHMDTVFPLESEFRDFRQDSEKCYGPGVIDMKGGLVAAIYALKSLDDLSLLVDLPVTMICNSDEEIGSPGSRELIRNEARKSAFAFVMEAGGLNGEVVVGRRGNMVLELKIEGAEGHAAFAGQNKASAVLELAQQTIVLEGLNDIDAGILVNVGLVAGGVGHNSIAAAASALVDCRFVNPEQQAGLQQKIAELAKTPATAGTMVRYNVKSERPAMPDSAVNIRLFEAVAAIAGELGQRLSPEQRCGVSDANLIAAEGIAVLDGLGPSGADDHSSAEYMVTASLAERTALLACAMVDCWQQHLAGKLF